MILCTALNLNGLLKSLRLHWNTIFTPIIRGWFDVLSFTLPTHNINLERGCLYGISIDNQPPKIISFSTKDRNEEWKLNVQRNTAIKTSQHFINNQGKHTLKVWLIDTDVCFDKFLINFGGLKPSYLGPLGDNYSIVK